MSMVIISITQSLDGFIAGANISEANPLGTDGARLHDWLFKDKTDEDDVIMKKLMEATGAVIVGNHTYSTAIHGVWQNVSPFHAQAFVICHRVPEVKVEGFTYVTDGIESALRQAKTLAVDNHIWLMGGANVIQQFLRAGLVDSIDLHIAPLLLKKGRRLFENTGDELIELTGVTVTHTKAVHIQGKVINSARSI